MNEEKKLQEAQLVDLAIKNQIDPNYLKAFTEVEGSGIGFSDYTGRLIIQFEPGWMKHFLNVRGETPSGTWLNNGISNQTNEWLAFNNACTIDKDAAMQSTSVGIMQVMGLHYKMLGFDRVQQMWDYAEVSEVNQVDLGIRFIKSNPILYKGVRDKNSKVVAYYYNGADYEALAKKLHETPYDQRLDNAYLKFASGSKVHVTTTTVNIRSGSGIMFDTIADPLRKNTVLTILSEHAGWSHVLVVATGITGWICSKYIS